MEKKLKILGIVSLLFGAAAALLCLFPGGILYAMPLGFVGMICSSAYVFYDTRDEVNKSQITPGIIGIVLSSIPVVLVVVFTVMNKMNH